MSAETFTLDITEDDLIQTGLYDDFTPGDYEGILVAVKDAKAASGNFGWKWVFQVKGLNFDITTWLKGGGLWKLGEVMASMGGELKPGSGQTLDPNLYIGSRAGVKIGKDPNQKNPKYADRLVILRTFPLADAKSLFEVPEL